MTWGLGVYQLECSIECCIQSNMFVCTCYICETIPDRSDRALPPVFYLLADAVLQQYRSNPCRVASHLKTAGCSPAVAGPVVGSMYQMVDNYARWQDSFGHREDR
jgi:hypothetical protein